MTPPDYIHSPSNKRRRLSVEDEQEMERASRVPRLYESSAALSQQRQLSPPPSRRSAETWAPATRASPYPPQNAMPPMQVAPGPEVSERHEHRHHLPSLPPMQAFDPRDPMHSQRPRGHSSEDFQQPRNAPMNAMANPGPPYRAEAGYPYGFHHPSRVQSLSVGAIQPFDRNAFSAGGYGQPYHQDFMRIGEVGPMGMNGDSKQRKRRGNLPKETTDKLRAWFVAHLQHPYPTEDEKQDLMRQTGLQMSESIPIPYSRAPAPELDEAPSIGPPRAWTLLDVGNLKSFVGGGPPSICNKSHANFRGVFPAAQTKSPTGSSTLAAGNCQQ